MAAPAQLNRLAKGTFARPAVLLALAAIGPLAIYAGFNAYVALSRREASMVQQSISNARFVAESVDRQVSAGLEDAATLAEAPALDMVGGRPADLEGFKTVAARTRARHPEWVTVVLLSPDGRWVYSTEPGGGGDHRMAEDPASLAQAVATAKPVVGDVVKGKRGKWGIPLRAPVVRDGKVAYVVTVVLSPDTVRQTLSGLRLPGPWITAIINHNDHVVARLPDSGVTGARVTEASRAAHARGGGGSYTGKTFQGEPIQTFYWVSPQSGWSARVAIPQSIYEAPLRQMVLVMVLGFVACLILAGALIVLWLREIEGRRRQGAAVEQATRIDALGRLTGGVAHDFNNLLTVIQGNTDILARRLQGNTQADRPLAAIRTATDRAAKLTRQLLVFARGGPAESSIVDLGRRVTDLLGPLSQLVGSGVIVETDIEPGLRPVLIDPLQLEAALLNLGANARDAMAGSGSVMIHLRGEGDAVILSVRDHGPGFDAAALPRVFDPFFTTKPVGQGTGLGLSQVYGLVKGAGGRVAADNAPGGGAVVTLIFPAYAGAEDAEPDARLAHHMPSSGLSLAAVLLVDDNDAVRATTAAYLRECGLSVIEAQDAAHALEALESAEVEAVVSDIIMPGEMDGMALAERIKARWPHLPVLLVSGFSERAADAQARGFPVVNKPYSLPDLEKRLQLLVERSGAPV